MLSAHGQTEQNKRKFLEALEQCKGMIVTACRNSGISRSVVYNWRREDKDFEDAVLEITEIQVDKVESKLIDLIDSGDTTAAIFYLKSKAKNRGYGDAIQGEITVRFEDEP